MMRTGSGRNVLLVSNQEELKIRFLQELLEAGIPVEAQASFKSWDYALQKQNCLVLLNPSFDEFTASSLTMLKARSDRSVFIFTDDIRWKEHTNNRSVYFLSTHTHPLELARLLVEKLNLPAVSNKPAYAFAFFQF
jgi:hypothetical protein